jgi:ADP-heptose:LPS heptosyltransferase
MILISPYAQRLKSGNNNPKNYPYWQELIAMINEPIIQVGIEGEQQLVPDFRKNLSIAALRQLIQECKTWVSCDSFIQHLAWDEKKKGIVLWSVSDPLIFGHPENINLLKSREGLATNQFLWWEYVPHRKELFVEPEIVAKTIAEF